MNLQMNPAQKISHLDLFLEKKAGIWDRVVQQGRRYELTPHATLGDHMVYHTRNHALDSLTAGIGTGVGTGVVNALFNGLGGAAAFAHNALVVDPRRKRLFESVVRTDPVVLDALHRNPDASRTLSEAYETMCRFAPSLALDVNAVRSFLREAVIGGAGGVNYATIKTLIETERGLH
jgi:hypothetical protein